MITPIHLLFDAGIYLVINKFGIIETNNLDLLIFFSAELIDLDHLLAKPIYDSRRNPFKTHFLHKNWLVILILSFILVFFRPVLFLGIGLLSHLLLDFCDTKINNSKFFNKKTAN